MSAVSHGSFSSHFTLRERGSSKKGTLFAWVLRICWLRCNSLVENYPIHISEMKFLFHCRRFLDEIPPKKLQTFAKATRWVKTFKLVLILQSSWMFHFQSFARCLRALFELSDNVRFEFVFFFSRRLWTGIESLDFMTCYAWLSLASLKASR